MNKKTIITVLLALAFAMLAAFFLDSFWLCAK